MKIKIFEKTEGCFPVEFEIGEWYDLAAARNIRLKAPVATTLRYSTKKNMVEQSDKPKKRDVEFQSVMIPLGVCMEIPKGYEAIIVPRSSTFKKWGVIQVNSESIIDNSFSSEQDEWMFPVLATRDGMIPKGTRIAQFRIQLSQRASMWQKIKWLFSGKAKLVKVDHLDNEPRGGFGEGTDNTEPQSKVNHGNENTTIIERTV